MVAKTTIAFFGATGGCTLNTLVHALKNGYPSVAFVRTPEKLTKLLTEEPHFVPQADIDANLTLVKGDILNVESIKPVFAHNPSIIISGIGGYPKLGFGCINPFVPLVWDPPHLCETAGRNVLAALNELEAENKLKVRPFFVVIGTTGISDSRDLPVAMLPMYKIMLHEPHVDKKAMEKVVVNAAQEDSPVLSGFAVVRPSLLTNGISNDLSGVKMGWDYHDLVPSGEKAPGPAIGYTISRADVGLWMYENLIAQDATQWNTRCISLTR